MASLSNLTLKQRFDKISHSGQTFSPLSWGCPRVLFAIDRSVFQKSPKEKALLKKRKAMFKSGKIVYRIEK